MENQVVVEEGKEVAGLVEGLSDTDLDVKLSEANVKPLDTPEKQDEGREVEEVKDASQSEEKGTVKDSEKEKLAKQVKDKEEFIQRQGNEIGELRKRVARHQTEIAELRVKRESVKEKAFEDPFAPIEAHQAEKDKEKELLHTMMELNEKVVAQSVPEISEYLDDIAGLAEADGFPAEAVRQFKATPWTSDPQIVIGYAKRVKMQREIQSLQTEVGKLKEAPKEVLRKIEDSVRSGKTLTAGAGSPRGQERLVAESEVPELSDTELDELLKEKTTGGI